LLFPSRETASSFISRAGEEEQQQQQQKKKKKIYIERESEGFLFE